jgi:hypothetical protein
MFISGWKLDEVLDLSWEQLRLCIYCMVSYKMEQVNMFAEMATSALGGKVNKKGKSGKKDGKKELSTKDRAAKEQALLLSIRSSGFSFD